MHFTQWYNAMMEMAGTVSLSHHKWGWQGLAEDQKFSAAREATRGFSLTLLFLYFSMFQGYGNTQVWGRCADSCVKVVIGSRII